MTILICIVGLFLLYCLFGHQPQPYRPPRALLSEGAKQFRVLALPWCVCLRCLLLDRKECTEGEFSACQGGA